MMVFPPTFPNHLQIHTRYNFDTRVELYINLFLQHTLTSNA